MKHQDFFPQENTIEEAQRIIDLINTQPQSTLLNEQKEMCNIAIKHYNDAKIHTTIGLYPNMSYKSNGVPSKKLLTHLMYNLIFRPGRALFLDGKCIYKGIGISQDDILIHNQLFHNPKYILHKDTMPYH